MACVLPIAIRGYLRGTSISLLLRDAILGLDKLTFLFDKGM
jgi:hypothetical protein